MSGQQRLAWNMCSRGPGERVRWLASISVVAAVTLLAGCGGQPSAPPRSSSGEPAPKSPAVDEFPAGQQAEAADPDVSLSPEADADQAATPGRLAALAQSISQAYEAAKSSGQTAATSARDWILNDVSSGGRWEYRVVPTTEKDPELLESLLNGFGRDGWECFHVESKGDALMLLMRRHPSGITRNIPFSDLMKVLPYLGFRAND